MTLISKRLTRGIYSGSDLVLANFSGKANLRTVRVINAAGTGNISFAPTSQFNSYTTVKANDVLEIDAAVTGFDFPGLLLTAGGGGGGSDAIQLSGPNGVTVSEFEESFTATSAATPTVAFSSGTGTVQYSTNGGASWAALPASIPAGTAFMLRVQHTAAFSATLTLTY